MSVTGELLLLCVCDEQSPSAIWFVSLSSRADAAATVMTAYLDTEIIQFAAV